MYSAYLCRGSNASILVQCILCNFFIRSRYRANIYLDLTKMCIGYSISKKNLWLKKTYSYPSTHSEKSPYLLNH